MVVDERSRHQLYRRLEEVLGSEAATTLIEHLPPVGWADVATKQDLAGLEERIDLRFAGLDDRFTGLEERFTERFARVDDRFNAMGDHVSAAVSELRATLEHEMRALTISFGQEVRSQGTTTMFALVGVVLTMAALAFALVRFA